MVDLENSDIRDRISKLAHTVRRLERRLDAAEASQPGLTPDEQSRTEELHSYREEVRAQNSQLLDLLEDLADARERYVDLYDLAPFPYFTLDGGGAIREVNLTGAEMLETPRERLVGWPLVRFVANESHTGFLEHMRRCRNRAADGTAVTTELTLAWNDHRPVEVEIHSRPSRQFHGDDVQFRTVVIDLTERHAAEKERRELLVRQQAAEEANAAKDRFLAMLSHELRTPLTPALLILQRLQARSDLSAEVADQLARACRNIELEVRLIDDLLDLHRIQTEQLELESWEVNLHQVLESVADICSDEIAGESVSLVLKLDAATPMVSGDSTRIHQIFWNLVRNAARYTPAGGRITVQSRDSPDGPVVTVSDTGQGMSERTLAHLFDPFHRGGRSGTASPGRGGPPGLGLGLAISRRLVRLHGGRISASSPGVGGGATFEVVLPGLAKEAAATRNRHSEAEAEQSAERTPARTSNSLRILLVEDHSDTADAMADLLRQLGHEVAVADSVAAAVDRDPADLDVLVSDFALPDGTGGDVLHALRRERRLPAIVISGFGDAAHIRLAREAGFEQHLIKPVGVKDLLAAIARLDTETGRERE